MKPASSGSTTYLPSLDILRALAVLVVMVSHAMYEMLPGGWVAVELFFVISGYLITSILLKEQAATGTISIHHFYFRRALRLLPALTFAIVLANIIWPFTHLVYDGKQLLATFSAIFYFTNCIRGNASGNLFHLWSLSVEEHFYLLWPFVFAWLIKKKPGFAAIFIIASVTVLATVKIVYVSLGLIVTWKDIYLAPQLFTPFKIDAILCGCLLAFIPVKSMLPKQVRKYLGALFLLMFAVIIITLNKHNAWYLCGGFLLVNVLCTFTVLMAITTNVNKVPCKNILLWIGKRSYGLYLYHMPVFMLFDNFHEPHNRLNFVLLFSAKMFTALILAAVSYQLIELPFLRMKKNFQQVPQQA